MSDDMITKEIGMADKLTMDEFVRALVSQMFEADNDTAELEVVLNGSGGDNPPRIMLQLRLTSINGDKTGESDDE